jgi:hypothetical protein
VTYQPFAESSGVLQAAPGSSLSAVWHAAISKMAWPQRLKIGERAFWLAFAYSVHRAPASVGVGVE